MPILSRMFGNFSRVQRRDSVESCYFQALYKPWHETHFKRWLIPPYRQGEIWSGCIPTSFLRKIRAGIYVATDAVPLAEAKVKKQERLTQMPDVFFKLEYS